MKKLLLLLTISGSALLSSAQIHFQEDFENGLPGTWTTFRGANGIGTIEDWGVATPGSASDSCMFVDYEAAPGVTEDWLVSPLITMGTGINQLIFDMAQDFNDDYGSIYEVRVSTTSQTNISSFTTVQTWTETDFVAEAWVQQIVDLSAYSNSSIYIAFVLTQNDGDSWYVDEMVVETPTCLVPSNLTASNITNNGATLEWSGAGLNYEIQYIPTPTSSLINLTATDSSYVLSGLLSNSTISYIVREICGSGDTSLWSNVYSFTTLCTPNTTLPYTQNFDVDTNASLPCGWITENNNNDNVEWRVSSGIANSNPKSLFIGFNGLLNMDDWVISPEFSLIGGVEYELSFSYLAGDTYLEDFSIFYGNGQSSANLTNNIATFTNIDVSTYVDTVIKFTPSASGNFSIGIHGTSLADQNLIAIDDFGLAMAPTTSVKEINSNDISLYPNPSNGVFTVNNNTSDVINVSITDINGRVIKTTQNLSAEAKHIISLDNNAKGIYTVNISNANNTITKRITVQ